MHRRDFLRTTVGAVSGAAVPNVPPISPKTKGQSGCARIPMYDETLAASTDLELLGIPRSWWFVHHGLHPFSPERTLIISDPPTPYWNYGEMRSLTERLSNEPPFHGPPHEKKAVSQLIYAACLVTQTYGVPERLEAWSRKYLFWLDFYQLLVQDYLWLCPEGCQASVTFKTMNGVVDWWLILVPGGIENVSTDGTRLHVLVTPVFSHLFMPRRPVEYWQLMACSLGIRGGCPGPTIDSTWLDVSQMDRKSACLFLNERIANYLGPKS